MPVVMEVKMHGAAELLVSLERVRRTISTGITSSVGRRLGTEGLRITRKLTPRRSSRRILLDHEAHRGQPFWKQWQLVEQIATANAYRAIIRNKATKGGYESPGFRALAAVEFGGRAHRIAPRGNYPLRWRQGRSRNKFVGRTLLEIGLGDRDVMEGRSRAKQRSGDIFAWTVNHPGNHPFHMVRDTKLQMNRVSDQLILQFQKEIEAAFGPLGVSIT